MLIYRIREAQQRFIDDYSLLPTHLYLGKDARFLLAKELPEQFVFNAPWRYLKLYGMQIVSVDSDMHFSLGLCRDIYI